jgi:hypothetical protein
MEEAEQIGLPSLLERRAAALPVLDTKQAELVAAQEEERALKARIAHIMPQIAAARREQDALFAQYADEAIDLGDACDAAAYGEILARKRASSEFLAQTLQRLAEVRLPFQTLQRLCAVRDACEAEAEICNLEALISAEELRLALLPLLESEGEISAAGAKTEALAVRAVQAWARHAQAVIGVSDELAKQARNQQLRASTGILTTRNLSS